MTLMEQFKNAILNADWDTVCVVYNKITGENIEPPIIKQEEPVLKFDWRTAKKAELYDWLKDKRVMEPIKTYKVSDLREIAEAIELFNEASLEEDEPELSKPFLDKVDIDRAPSFFINKKPNAYQSSPTTPDLKRANQKFNIRPELGAFGTEGTTGHTTSSRDPFKLYKAMCNTCNVLVEVQGERIYSIPGEGPRTTCDSCMAAKRG